MASSRMKAKIIRVTVEKGREGLFYAESPDLKGLLVARPSMEELRKQIPVAIREMFELNDIPVAVSEVDGDGDCSWVAVPTELLVLNRAVAC
jgi:hypothetical protein